MIRVQSSKNLHLVIPFSDVLQVVYFLKLAPQRDIQKHKVTFSVLVDPGFPVGGRQTPNVATFYKICVSKQLGHFWNAPWIHQW